MYTTGDKCYKWVNGKLELIRVINETEDGGIVILDSIGDKILDRSELDKYNKLKADGFVLLNIVKMGNGDEYGKDIIATFFRDKDIKEGNNIPYAVCRQNILDTFTNIVKNQDVEYVGLSMNVDNVPKEANYMDLLACYNVETSERINIYLDDTIDDILNIIPNISIYDKVLKDIYEVLSTSDTFKGYCPDLETLLKQNSFIYDIHCGFGILDIPFKIEIKDNSIIEVQRLEMENILKCKIGKTFVLKYDKTYNLNDIEREFVLLCDAENKIYIFAYDKGDYTNPYYLERKDSKEIIDMISSMKNKL